MNTTPLRTYATTVLHYGGLLLFAGALLLVVIINVPQAIGADHSYVVLSDSMTPTYSAGDVVIVRSVPPDAIEAGDVITFRQPDAGQSRTTHRVVDVVHREGDRYFRTQGDANENPDPHLVPASRVIGRVWVHLPAVGYGLLFARSRSGLVLLVIVPAALLILTEAYELVHAARSSTAGGSEQEPTDDDRDREPAVVEEE